MRNSFGIGDIVNVGKANTEWEITEETSPAVYTLKSAKGSTRKNVSWDTLTLVRDAAPTLTDSQVEELDETYADHGMPAAQELKAEYFATPDAENVLDAAISEQHTWDNTYTVPSEPYAAWEIDAMHPGRTHVLHVDGWSKAFKSYGAAADALVLAGRDGYTAAAIDHDGQRLVTR